MSAERDRRRGQRVDARLRLEVRLPRDDGGLERATLETLNISTSGVYFESDHFIEPMTKLDMVLQLPVPAKSAQAGAAVAPLHCEGIVVRVVPEAPEPGRDRYEVAVFFTHFDPDGLGHLEKHIALLLAHA
jgi:hypothetical protein